jgi:hypothetical protein
MITRKEDEVVATKETANSNFFVPTAHNSNNPMVVVAAAA